MTYAQVAGNGSAFTAIATSTSAPIQARALLVSLTIRLWTARKGDRTVTSEVHQQHAAKRSAGIYSKHLLGDARELAAVVTAAGAGRTAHYAATLPWADEGWRLLPSAQWLDYTERMRAAQLSFDGAVRELVAAYPRLRDEARSTLGSMYRATDYPNERRVADRYGWEVNFSPIPSGDDIRLTLDSDAVDNVRSSVENRVTAAVNAAARDCWARLHSAVSHIHERLSDKEAIFRDSLIANARDLVDVLARLNVTDDPALDVMRQRVESLLVPPAALRADADLRAAKANEAARILAAMSPYYAPDAESAS